MTTPNEGAWFPDTLEEQARLILDLIKAEGLPFEVSAVMETKCAAFHRWLRDPRSPEAQKALREFEAEQALAVAVQPDDETSEVGWVDSNGHGYVWSCFPDEGRTEVVRVTIDEQDGSKKGIIKKETSGWRYEGENALRNTRFEFDAADLDAVEGALSDASHALRRHLRTVPSVLNMPKLTPEQHAAAVEAATIPEEEADLLRDRLFDAARHGFDRLNENLIRSRLKE